MDTYPVPEGTIYQDWQAVFDKAQAMPWTAFNTGYITGALKNNAQAESFPANRNPDELYDYAVMAFHFRHPMYGDVLIDTGFDRSFHECPPYGNLSFTMRLYNKLMNVRYFQDREGIDLDSHLITHSIEPAHVFLTHLHADHTGGLPSIPPQVPIYFGLQERTLLTRLLCGNHLSGKSSVRPLDLSNGRTLEPFSRVLDVFGDGTFWAISTPGHSRDHLAYLINTAPAPILIVGDAELTGWAMQDGILVGTVDGEAGKREVQSSAGMIRAFHERYPHVQIWFSHDEDHLQ